MKLRYLQQALAEGRYELSGHALVMMTGRNVGLDDLISAVAWGQVLEVNPDAKPFPTTLVSGPTAVSGEAIHVVFSRPAGADRVTVVTVYYPDELLWHKAKIRKRKPR